VSRVGDRAYWLPFDSERPVWLAFKNPSGQAESCASRASAGAVGVAVLRP
jgi:hypothetical protein